VLNKKIKKDLIKDITFKTGLSSNVSKKIFDDLVNILIQNIKKGSLVLKNVGSFKIIEKKERIGRNPKTKKEFIISARKTVSFTPSKKIIENLNKLI
jgi:integration host factor subunit alpha